MNDKDRQKRPPVPPGLTNEEEPTKKKVGRPRKSKESDEDNQTNNQ